MASLEASAASRAAGDLAAKEYDDMLKVLVIGGAGNGKSTLIRRNIPIGADEVPETGDDSDGVTKDILKYIGIPLPNGRKVLWVDSPGLGDIDMKPAAVIAAYELAFKKEYMNGIDAVVVTVNLGAGARRDLSTQLAEVIVRKGFDNTNNVILCGTRSDLAKQTVTDEFHGKLKRKFFKSCGNSAEDGMTALVHQDDYSNLINALQSLPAGQVKYTPPCSTELGREIAETLGADPEITIKQLQHRRQANDAHLEAMRRTLKEGTQVASNSLLGMFSANAAAQIANEVVGQQVQVVLREAGAEAIKESARYASRTLATDTAELGARALSKGGASYVLGGQVINTAAASGATLGAGIVPGLVSVGVEIAAKKLGASAEAAKGCGFASAAGTGAALGAAAGPVGAAAGAGVAAALWVGSQILSAFVVDPVLDALTEAPQEP